jgi:hypothetical protein
MNNGFFRQVTRDKPRICCRAAKARRKMKFVITCFCRVITRALASPQARLPFFGASPGKPPARTCRALEGGIFALPPSQVELIPPR